MQKSKVLLVVVKFACTHTNVCSSLHFQIRCNGKYHDSHLGPAQDWVEWVYRWELLIPALVGSK